MKCENCGKIINTLYPNSEHVIYHNKHYCCMQCSEMDNEDKDG
jgi:hypothetical protein